MVELENAFVIAGHSNGSLKIYNINTMTVECQLIESNYRVS